MIDSFYLPVLKTKQGEFDALFSLNPSIKGYVVPLIEVAKLEFDNADNAKPKTIETHLDNVCKRISTKWGRSNAFIDTHLVNDSLPGQKNCIEYIFKRLAEGPAIPYPTIRLTTPEIISTAINNILSEFNLKEIAFRIFIADIIDPEFPIKVDQLLGTMKFEPECCHLVLDLDNADFSNANEFSEVILDYLQAFPHFNRWKSFSVSGGSFPKSNLLKPGINEVRRGEWMFFNKLVDNMRERDIFRPLNYGDYGIVAPGHFEFDPFKMDRSANIRYTHDDIWYVIKGNSLKTQGHGQYFALAKKVTESGLYLGENFSAGDSHLKKCALSLTTSGNPTVWNKIGFNHHFSKVIKDLRASYLAA